MGFPDRARERLRQLDDEDLLTPATLEEQLVVASLVRDAALADRVLPLALKNFENLAETDRTNISRFVRALHHLANDRPADAADEVGGVPMTPGFSQVQALIA